MITSFKFDFDRAQNSRALGVVRAPRIDVQSIGLAKFMPQGGRKTLVL